MAVRGGNGGVPLKGVSKGNDIWRVEFFEGLGMTGEGNLLGGCSLG